VLEGGQTKEDKARQEVFWNTTLAPDDISRLFEPKVLTGFERWDAEAVAAGTPKPVGRIADDDNLLIKGNNLLTLHSLKARYAGAVKLIYIDPPYNTGSDGFGYNDKFNHSAWLTFMRNRLDVAKDILRRDGSIFVTLDDTEVHYCKVLMDEIFGREKFVAHIAWQKRTSPDNRVVLGNGHDNILVFAKTQGSTKRANGTIKTLFEETANRLPMTAKQRAEYANPDNDPKGDWVHRDFTAQNKKKNGVYGRLDQIYPITTKAGSIQYPTEGRCWIMTEPEYKKLLLDGRIWFGVHGDGMPRKKLYLAEEDGIQSWTWWPHSDAGTNEQAKSELIDLIGADAASDFTPKPERLIERIMHVATKPGDLVLDFFAGSGTTAAVAQKMGRRWIAVEQMDYVHDLTARRLKKVIGGERGGISATAHWKGGGSFVYAELAQWNARLADDIRDAPDAEALSPLRDRLRTRGYVRPGVMLDGLTDAEFDALPLDSQKRVLIDCLDANHLYVNYGDMADEAYGISDEDMRVNRAFYGEKA
jgi:adenine-specific DNA-methyltransferase